MSVTSVRCRTLLLAASSLLLSACLDLALPNVPLTEASAPSSSSTRPARVTPSRSTPAVSLDAASVNGVASVTVTCGGAPSTGVFSWSVAPYTGIVDFTRCTLVTNGVNDAGIGQLQLTFVGVDRWGT